MLSAKVQILIDEIILKRDMATSSDDLWYFITELVPINPNLGIPALEDGLFANLLIFDYIYHTYILIYERNSFNSLVSGDS